MRSKSSTPAGNDGATFYTGNNNRVMGNLSGSHSGTLTYLVSM